MAPDLWDPPRPRAERGRDGIGDSYGGAILCENGSSPKFYNCVIANCQATGGHGGAGAEGVSTAPSPPNPSNWTYIPPLIDPPTPQTTNDGQWGGHGGMGSGNGHGGAMACLDGSKPVLIGCTFEDNVAYGGFGGNAGNGGDGSGYESWPANGGDAAATAAAARSSPTAKAVR